jgi:hypothetical protein
MNLRSWIVQKTNRDFATSDTDFCCIACGVSSMMIGDAMKARLESVLQETFLKCPHGGDHIVRALVANRLLDAVQAGIVDIEDLKRIAQAALLELSQPPKSA